MPVVRHRLRRFNTGDSAPSSQSTEGSQGRPSLMWNNWTLPAVPAPALTLAEQELGCLTRSWASLLATDVVPVSIPLGFVLSPAPQIPRGKKPCRGDDLKAARKCVQLLKETAFWGRRGFLLLAWIYHYPKPQQTSAGRDAQGQAQHLCLVKPWPPPHPLQLQPGDTKPSHPLTPSSWGQESGFTLPPQTQVPWRASQHSPCHYARARSMLKH